jgi:hypothetical protein
VRRYAHPAYPVYSAGHDHELRRLSAPLRPERSRSRTRPSDRDDVRSRGLLHRVGPLRRRSPFPTHRQRGREAAKRGSGPGVRRKGTRVRWLLCENLQESRAKLHELAHRLSWPPDPARFVASSSCVSGANRIRIHAHNVWIFARFWDVMRIKSLLSPGGVARSGLKLGIHDALRLDRPFLDRERSGRSGAVHYPRSRSSRRRLERPSSPRSRTRRVRSYFRITCWVGSQPEMGDSSGWVRRGCGGVPVTRTG